MLFVLICGVTLFNTWYIWNRFSKQPSFRHAIACMALTVMTLTIWVVLVGLRFTWALQWTPWLQTIDLIRLGLIIVVAFTVYLLANETGRGATPSKPTVRE